MLEAISATRATLAWLPNFAYNLMTRRDPESLRHTQLDSLRMLINCSEPVRAASHELFARQFGDRGLRPEALTACYGMAEATFAVTQTAPGSPARVVAASRHDLSAGKFVAAKPGINERLCVSSGKPIRDCVVRIAGLQGEELGDGLVGAVPFVSGLLFFLDPLFRKKGKDEFHKMPITLDALEIEDAPQLVKIAMDRVDAWSTYRTATFDYLQSKQQKDGSWLEGKGLTK